MEKRAHVFISAAAAVLILAAFLAWTCVKEKGPSASNPAGGRAGGLAAIALELADAASPHLDSLPGDDRAAVEAVIAKLRAGAEKILTLAAAGGAPGALEAATEDLERLLSEIIVDYRPGAYYNEGSPPQ